MDTFLTHLILFVSSPLLGYLCLKKLKASALRIVLSSLVVLSASYLLLKAFGLNTRGEEGDYTFIAFGFLFLNITLFQLLRYRRNWLAIGLFICFAAGSVFIVAWTALITVMYVVRFYITPLL